MDELRRAARKGDHTALALAIDQMRTLALSPRYWERYLALLKSPLARLVDLLVIKQGERIAYQKGWKIPGGGLRPPPGTSPRKGLRGGSPRVKGEGTSGKRRGKERGARRGRAGVDQLPLFGG
jgi:hypothetical protein